MPISTVKSSPTPCPPWVTHRREGNGVTGFLATQAFLWPWWPLWSVKQNQSSLCCCAPFSTPACYPRIVSFPSALGMGFSGWLGSWVRQKVFSFLGWFLSFKLLQFRLKEEINIVTVRKMHKITPTAENFPPPAAAEGLLGSCSLRYINSHHTWLTHTAMGQHIVGWQDKVKFNYCYFHDEWSISSIGFKKLDETAVTGRVVRSWNMRLPFSCEEQSVSSKIIFFFLSDKLWHC